MVREQLITGGLTRFSAFLKLAIAQIKSSQDLRVAGKEPSLLNPYRRIDDPVYAFIIGISLFMFRLRLQRTIMPRLFPGRSRRLIAKLTEDLYYTGYYTVAFGYFLFAVLPNVDWGCRLWENGASVVSDLLNPLSPPLTLVERWYYIQAGGFYLSATMFLLLHDSRRSDYMQYVLHHAVTIGMVIMSYLYGYVRVGMTVLALHDVGDIFLYSSKFCHHLGIKGIDIALFSAFAVTFYLGRMVLYARIVHGIVVEALQVLVADPTFNQWGIFYDTYLPHYVFFAISLSTLLALHCFWFTLILRLVGDELFFGKKISEQGDIRSDDEDEDEPLLEHEDDDDENIDSIKK